MTEFSQYIIIFLLILILIILFVALNAIKSMKRNDTIDKAILKEELNALRMELVQYIQSSFNGLGELLANSQKQSTDIQDKRLQELNNLLSQRIQELNIQLSQRTQDLNTQLTQKNDNLQKSVNDMLVQVESRLKTSALENEQKLEQIRSTMENRIAAMQSDNSKKLDEMRATVDEKLQKTLEERIGQSFKLVSDRLEQVYKGLGEMQTLATGVGDLKKVLSNVKTRGILGEIQLGSILKQILSPEQYEENIVTRKGSTERVEFAIKLPGDGEEAVYLPIDAKFPADTYAKLVDAYENGNPEEIDQAAKALDRAIKSFAKSIHDKYIEPPKTTDFGIMFLPFEGLYAEAVRRGMVEILQRDYKINIAGPTTMAALLNSLQMGFKTLAIQKHSSEVWNVLGAVKTEFDKFGTVLAATQQRINQANAELDKLVGARTRKIQSKLRNVVNISEQSSREILGLEDVDDEEPKFVQLNVAE